MSNNIKMQKYLFKRDKYPEIIEANEIKEYDNFISPEGYEIIILPFYTKQENIYELKQNNFQIVQRNVGNEQFIFAYKNPHKLLEVKKKYKLCVMTLFYREQPHELNNFFDYYRNQGVDYFYMYYNGKLKEKINLPKYTDVEYLEWDFYYWLQQGQLRIHHAQIPAMIHFQKKYLPYCDYALMIDTDEFLYNSEQTIQNYLIEHKIDNHLFTNHNWAKVNLSKKTIEFVKEDPNRGKSIIVSKKFKITDPPNVHKIIGSTHCNIDLFHNNKSRHKEKYDNIINIQY